MKKLMTKIRNFFFCLKYPFWKAYNVWNDKFCGYSFTMYDWIPHGWVTAFGKDLSKELKQAIKLDKKESGHKSRLKWYDIKEKWGQLVLSASCGPHARHVLEKYEYLSLGYCQNCGSPVRYVTKGYVCYICKDCASADDRLICSRISESDLPSVIVHNQDGTHYKKDLVKEYGVDLLKIWGIKK